VLPVCCWNATRSVCAELLRNVYKYDVDGALIVFVQDEKWRLSLVSEIRALDEDGNISKIATEPKRHTYLLGRDEKTRTPVDGSMPLLGKPQALEDIRKRLQCRSAE
jgi:hypothetical protein